MFSSFFGGERKHSHFPKLKSEKVNILTSPSIFADVGTKITVMENILHAFSLDKTEPLGTLLSSGGTLNINNNSVYTNTAYSNRTGTFGGTHAY